RMSCIRHIDHLPDIDFLEYVVDALAPGHFLCLQHFLSPTSPPDGGSLSESIVGRRAPGQPGNGRPHPATPGCAWAASTVSRASCRSSASGSGSSCTAAMRGA